MSMEPKKLLPIRVLVTDDHQLVRDCITGAFKGDEQIQIVAAATSGEEAVELYNKLKPDVVLMDLQMPGIGGIGAIKKILHQNPDAKILVLTVYDNDLYPRRMLDEGARGYITKNCNMNELANAIRIIYAGDRYLCPEIASKLALKTYRDSSSPFDLLSKRELQIVMMITEGRTPKEIADVLNLSVSTINTYRHRILRKLDVKNYIELTYMASHYGIAENLG